MTTAEVAEICRVDQSTVRRWVDEGRIHVVRLPGGRLRFRRSDVDTILAGIPATPGSAA
jgi:excisionase family DNA binding protein